MVKESTILYEPGSYIALDELISIKKHGFKDTCRSVGFLSDRIYSKALQFKMGQLERHITQQLVILDRLGFTFNITNSPIYFVSETKVAITKVNHISNS